MQVALVFTLAMVVSTGVGQGIDVDYDKNRDFSGYRTFKIGDGEVITPKDKLNVEKAKLHRWMKEAITTKFTEKGLQVADSSADLVASYVIGSKMQYEQIDLGAQPLNGVIGAIAGVNGGGGGSDKKSRTWSRDFQASSIIIDLHDKSNNLVWRVNAATDGGTTDNEGLIKQVVNSGFKKFSLKPRKVKTKKSH